MLTTSLSWAILSPGDSGPSTFFFSSLFFFFFFFLHLLLLNERLFKTCSCFIRCHIITQLVPFHAIQNLTNWFGFFKKKIYTVHYAWTIATLQNVAISSGHAYLLFIFCTSRMPPYECTVLLYTRHVPHLDFRDTFSFCPFEFSKMWLLLYSSSLLAS